MKLTGKLKTQADYAAMKEEQKEIDKKASIRLTDDELDQVAGGEMLFGGGYQCKCSNPSFPPFSQRCSNCGGHG